MKNYIWQGRQFQFEDKEVPKDAKPVATMSIKKQAEVEEKPVEKSEEQPSNKMKGTKNK